MAPGLQFTYVDMLSIRVPALRFHFPVSRIGRLWVLMILFHSSALAFPNQNFQLIYIHTLPSSRTLYAQMDSQSSNPQDHLFLFFFSYMFSVTTYLDVVDEAFEALHLAMRPSWDAELAAPLLEHRKPDLELFGGLSDGHVEVVGELLEGDLGHPLADSIGPTSRTARSRRRRRRRSRRTRRRTTTTTRPAGALRFGPAPLSSKHAHQLVPAQIRGIQAARCTRLVAVRFPGWR